MERAAYFRLEGVLIQKHALSCATWIATRHNHISSRPLRLFGLGLARGVQSFGDQELALRVGFSALAGCSEDRWLVLANHYVQDVALPSLQEAGVRRLTDMKARGYAPILVATHPLAIAQGIAAHLGISHVISNRLQRNEYGRCTGQLVAPIVTGTLDAAALSYHATRLHLSTQQIAAFGATSTDVPMLASAKLPCAVTPDARLRQVAKQCGWPIVEARS